MLDEKTYEDQLPSQVEPKGDWLIIVNGSCNEQGSGAGMVIRSLEGVEISYVVEFKFHKTNN